MTWLAVLVSIALYFALAVFIARLRYSFIQIEAPWSLTSFADWATGGDLSYKDFANGRERTGPYALLWPFSFICDAIGMLVILLIKVVTMIFVP